MKIKTNVKAGWAKWYGSSGNGSGAASSTLTYART